jgi:hypothetical protein
VRGHIESLHHAGKLGEKEVATFAAGGQFEETCGLPIEPVDRAMGQDRLDALLVMAKAVGMSWPTTRFILRMRAGARGISPGELEQCLAIFTRLNSSTARQAIEYQSKRITGSQFSRNLALSAGARRKGRRCLSRQEFTPARIFSLNSAIAEIVWLVRGRSTGSPRSADRSAAL